MTSQEQLLMYTNGYHTSQLRRHSYPQQHGDTPRWTANETETVLVNLVYIFVIP